MGSGISQAFDLSGNVAIVTGAAQGLGASIARALALHGATAVLVDLEQAAVEAAVARMKTADAGLCLHAAECDVRDRQQVTECVTAVHDKFGRVDTLVNNAGIHRRVDPLDYVQEDIDAILAVNLMGCFHMSGAVGALMVKQESGSVINVSALGGGLTGLGRSGSAYGMSKGGIVALTRDLAAEWGRYGVRVNALAPGWIRTPMTRALQEDPVKAARVLERVPLGRWGTADDVAGAAVFLASDASGYISGHTIPVDGGAANVIAISND
ncbi:MAG: glucose 1-dehydrogenase [Planctomycetaceae bacterium]